MTSTVILRRVLELLGADVTHFIPERLRDGYGLEPAAVERLAADGVAVVVSVDCGIRSRAAALRARELGVDLIVTDHHEPEAALPPPSRSSTPSGGTATIPTRTSPGRRGLKLVQALCLRRDRSGGCRPSSSWPRWAPSPTSCPAGENRVIAKLGLERLSRKRHATGLQALLDSAGLLGES